MLTDYLKMLCLVLGYCLLGLCNGVVVASERPVATVDNLDQPFDLNPYIETIEDVRHEYTLEEIQAGKYDHLWQRNSPFNSQRYFSGGNFKSKYWFRLTLNWQGGENTLGVMYVDGQPGILSYLGIALSDTQHNTRVISTGDQLPYSSRDIDSNRYGFKVPLSNGRRILWGWVNNYDGAVPPILSLYLHSETGFYQTSNQVGFILVTFYAVMAALSFYNICLFVMLREPVYGYYIVFLISAVLTSASIDGVGHRWLWPNTPNMNLRIASSDVVFTAMIYLVFVMRALNGATFWPRFKRIYQIIFYLGWISLIHNLFTPHLNTASIITQLYSSLVMPVTLVLIIAAVWRKQPTAHYLLIAEIMTLSGAVNFFLMTHSIVPINMMTIWGLHWGFLGESLLLSLAVAARTNIIIQDKLKAQELAYANERKALEALETSTQIKNQFLTTVSHELRTPLNSIIGFSNVLLDSKHIQSDCRDHAQTILNNGKQLLVVVNDVLNLSLIDSNRLALIPRVIDLPLLVQGLEVKYRLKAQKSGLLFTVMRDKQLPQLIEIDDEHLTQILKQLLDNAFKFTHQGQVTLHVSPVDQTVEEHQETSLLFTLTDSGIGIPTDNLAQIFAPFTQADSSNTRRYSGTGVGLFIAKSVAEKMGGRLSVDSTPGVGTRFDLVLPMIVKQCHTATMLDEQQIKPVTVPERPKLRGRVLYAEDNLDNQQLVKILVSLTGAEITLVENGKAVIEAVNNAELPFDLILMDLQMPEMDGYEATAILKRSGCRTPVIACSASALAEVTSISDVVFEGYLGKPIDKMKLYAVLMEFLVAS